MKKFCVIISVFVGLYYTDSPAAKEAEINIADTLEVRPLTRSTTEVYDVLTQLIQAREAYAADLYERSYHAYKYVALHDKNNVEAALGTANSALEIGKTEEALAIFKNLSAADLDAQYSRPVQSGLILSKWQTQKISDPEAHLRAALKAAPNDARLWNALGHVYKRQKHWQEAALVYEKAHEAGYSRAGLYNNFGLMLMAQKNYGGAVRYFHHAAKLAPDNPRYDTHYRTALLIDGQYEAALEAMTDSRASALLTLSGELAIKNDNPELARLLLAKAIDISPVYNAKAEAHLAALKQAEHANPDTYTQDKTKA